MAWAIDGHPAWYSVFLILFFGKINLIFTLFPKQSNLTGNLQSLKQGVLSTVAQRREK